MNYAQYINSLGEPPMLRFFRDHAWLIALYVASHALPPDRTVSAKTAEPKRSAIVTTATHEANDLRQLPLAARSIYEAELLSPRIANEDYEHTTRAEQLAAAHAQWEENSTLAMFGTMCERPRDPLAVNAERALAGNPADTTCW